MTWKDDKIDLGEPLPVGTEIDPPSGEWSWSRVWELLPWWIDDDSSIVLNIVSRL
jgi:hypothetical protein